MRTIAFTRRCFTCSSAFFSPILMLCILALSAGSSLCAQATSPILLWPQPSAIPFSTPLSNIQLDAVALAAPPVPVSLGSSFNVVGITTDGFHFQGGFDGSSWAYSAELLGTSIGWKGISFPLGPANQPNAVSGGTIPLPAGSYGSLLLLGDLVNNQMPPDATFVVTYTDGTSKSYEQKLSDWVNPRNYPGEAIVECVPTRHNLDGTIDPNSVCVYGYQLSLDPTRTVQSISLPDDRDVVMISFVLLPPVVPGTISYSPSAPAVLSPGTAQLNAEFTPASGGSSTVSASTSLLITPPPVSLPTSIAWPAPAPLPYGEAIGNTQLNATVQAASGPVLVPLNAVYRVNAIYNDGSVYSEKGFDGSGLAYSATQLGSSLRYAGYTFPLGPLAVPDAATSTVVPLPSGNYTALDLLGAAANGPQTGQTFSVSYTDGTTASAQLNMSSWLAPQNFAGETTVASTTYAVTPSGGVTSASCNVYGYTIPLDPHKVVASLSLPDNPNVLLLAAGLETASTFPVQASLAYTPSAGAQLPLGVQTLAVTATPFDTADFLPSQGTTQIDVETPVLSLFANNATRMYGAANPKFSGSMAGALNGDVFNESFSTPASLQSSPGQYPIVPSANGPNISLYQLAPHNGTLTVTKASVSATLTISAGVVLQNQPVTMTANVASSTMGTPTGTASFYSGTTLVGTATLAQGVATLVSLLPVGTDDITYTYSGDSNFQALNAPTASTVSVMPLDFALLATHGNLLAGPFGSPISIVFHLAPLHGVYAGPVSFSLGGDVPHSARFSFSPSAVNPSDGATDITLTLNTPSPSSGVVHSASSKPIFASWILGLMLPFVLRTRKKMRVVTSRYMLSVVLLSALTMMSACSTSYRYASYPLTVTANDGTVQHTLSFTLQFTQ